MAAGSAASNVTHSPAKDAGDPSQAAFGLSAIIERALADGRLDVLTPEALQAVFGSLCKLYGANIEAGGKFLPINGAGKVTPTDVMVVASKLLRAENLQVFELGMWESWNGR